MENEAKCGRVKVHEMINTPVSSVSEEIYSYVVQEYYRLEY